MDEISVVKELAPPILGAGLSAIQGKTQTMIERTVGFLCGFCIAYFFTAPVVDFFHLSTATYGGGIGFALGYFGKSIADSVMNTPWSDIIKARLSK